MSDFLSEISRVCDSVEERTNYIFPANSAAVADNKGHFPLSDVAQARNALAQVAKYDALPKWYIGNLSLEKFKAKVRKDVKAAFPSIKVTDGEPSKKPARASGGRRSVADAYDRVTDAYRVEVTNRYARQFHDVLEDVRMRFTQDASNVFVVKGDKDEIREIAMQIGIPQDEYTVKKYAGAANKRVKDSASPLSLDDFKRSVQTFDSGDQITYTLQQPKRLGLTEAWFSAPNNGDEDDTEWWVRMNSADGLDWHGFLEGSPAEVALEMGDILEEYANSEDVRDGCSKTGKRVKDSSEDWVLVYDSDKSKYLVMNYFKYESPFTENIERAIHFASEEEAKDYAHTRGLFFIPKQVDLADGRVKDSFEEEIGITADMEREDAHDKLRAYLAEDNYSDDAIKKVAQVLIDHDWTSLKTQRDGRKELIAVATFQDGTPAYSYLQRGWQKIGDAAGGDVINGLEWASENLSGHGGTEVDGNWYYTWDQAMAAAAEVGDGWRLPTRAEFERLCALGSSWDDDRKGRVFGGKLFLPADGSITTLSRVITEDGRNGCYWSSSSSSEAYAASLNFGNGGVYPVSNSSRNGGFSVRLVRDKDGAKEPVKDSDTASDEAKILAACKEWAEQPAPWLSERTEYARGYKAGILQAKEIIRGFFANPISFDKD